MNPIPTCNSQICLPCDWDGHSQSNPLVAHSKSSCIRTHMTPQSLSIYMTKEGRITVKSNLALEHSDRCISRSLPSRLQDKSGEGRARQMQVSLRGDAVANAGHIHVHIKYYVKILGPERQLSHLRLAFLDIVGFRISFYRIFGQST